MFKHLFMTAALTAILAGAGSAAPLLTVGNGVISVANVSETAPNSISSATDTLFTQLPGAARTYVVSSPNDLFTVTFSAETQCRDTAGAATGWCALRIVASQGSTILVFNPNALTNGVSIRDFAFDSNPTGISNADESESHSITHSARLQAGTWTIRVQRAIEVTAGSTTFQLDDWNLNIVVSD